MPTINFPLFVFVFVFQFWGFFCFCKPHAPNLNNFGPGEPSRVAPTAFSETERDQVPSTLSKLLDPAILEILL